MTPSDDPDLLPSLPGDKPADGASPSSDAPSGSSSDANGSASHPAADGKTGDIDWDAELSKLLGEDGEDGENGNSEDTRHSQPAFSQFPLLNVQEHSVCITDARHKNRDGRLCCAP